MERAAAPLLETMSGDPLGHRAEKEKHTEHSPSPSFFGWVPARHRSRATRLKQPKRAIEPEPANCAPSKPVARSGSADTPGRRTACAAAAHLAGSLCRSPTHGRPRLGGPGLPTTASSAPSISSSRKAGQPQDLQTQRRNLHWRSMRQAMGFGIPPYPAQSTFPIRFIPGEDETAARRPELSATHPRRHHAQG